MDLRFQLPSNTALYGQSGSGKTSWALQGSYIAVLEQENLFVYFSFHLLVFNQRDLIFNPPPRFISVHLQQLSPDLKAMLKKSKIDEFVENSSLENMQMQFEYLKEYESEEKDPETGLIRRGSIVFYDDFSAVFNADFSNFIMVLVNKNFLSLTHSMVTAPNIK